MSSSTPLICIWQHLKRVVFPSLVACLVLAWGGSSAAWAARYALVIGVGKYDKDSGIESVPVAASDAEAISKALSALSFEVTLLRDDDVRDRTKFDGAFDVFKRRIQPNDDVVIYFSGHGFHSPERGNFYLLSTAMSETAYLKGPGAANARTLDNQDAREKAYQSWLSQVAVSENELQTALKGRAAQTIVFIADAARNLNKNSPPLRSEVRMPPPATAALGVFRLYAAGPGQISLEASDRPQGGRAGNSKSGSSSSSSSSSSSRRDGAETSRTQSLFTRVLLREFKVTGVDMNVLAAKIKVAVYDQSRDLLGEQVPDYNDDKQSTRFMIAQPSVEEDKATSARCESADLELQRLRVLVSRGSIGREAIERKWFELAPCNKGDEVASLLRLEAQGAGALSGSAGDQALGANIDDPVQKCDFLASSPLDANRLQGVGAGDIQQVALRAISGDIRRSSATDLIQQAIDACKIAVETRDKVARYKFNLGRAHYAMSLLVDGKARAQSLERASTYLGQAVDFGYAAAYNALGQLYLNGEIYVISPAKSEPERYPADRDRARRLFQRGADLNDVLANYNLGMSFKNGENGQQLDRSKAFQAFSKAAEAGFIPAMIQTALDLRDGRGVARNRPRAIELLDVAASRGSSEAMYFLGEMYLSDYIEPDLFYSRDINNVDYNESVIWYARAAELGDSRAQARLAEMLANGTGLPAPQPEAAGRYWRLAAEGGSSSAQLSLANLIRETKIPFRPKVGGTPDGGAHEVRGLYLSAFARGYPVAGLELARLYRTGFPKERGSDSIPRDADRAITLLRDVIDRVKAAPNDSDAANPVVEVQAGLLLVEMYNAGENKRRDGSIVLNEFEYKEYKDNYGDPSEMLWINLDGIRCRSQYLNYIFPIWNWSKPAPPTEQLFDWFERRNKCKEIAPDDKKTKLESLGIVKSTRDIYKREHEASLKDKTGSKTFVKRMDEYLNKETEKSDKKRR